MEDKRNSGCLHRGSTDHFPWSKVIAGMAKQACRQGRLWQGTLILHLSATPLSFVSMAPCDVRLHACISKALVCPLCSWDQPGESRWAAVGCWVWCSLVLSRHTLRAWFCPRRASSSGRWPIYEQDAWVQGQVHVSQMKIGYFSAFGAVWEPHYCFPKWVSMGTWGLWVGSRGSGPLFFVNLKHLHARMLPHASWTVKALALVILYLCLFSPPSFSQLWRLIDQPDSILRSK